MSFQSLSRVLCAAVLVAAAGAANANNQISTEPGVTLTQLPYYGGSSFGIDLLLAEDDLLVISSDTPAHNRYGGPTKSASSPSAVGVSRSRRR